MSNVRDLKGQRFGRLLVLYDTGERKDHRVVWRCRCDCGNETNVRGSDLTSGNTTSCGCYMRERAAEVHTVHGMGRRGREHPVYNTWHSMIQRCENPDSSAYKNYGGRGIIVCEEWHEFISFRDWALASGWERGLQLDRIDNDGNYESTNCRWATRKEQARNKRNNRFITLNGRTQSLAAWAEEANIPYNVLMSRVYCLHWPIERALITAVRGYKHVG